VGTYATTTALSTVMVGTRFDTATTALATKCIDQAEGRINAALAKRYDLSSSYFQTSTACPPALRALAENLSEGLMWQKMARGSKESMARGKDLVEQSLEELKALVERNSDLVDTSGSVVPDSSSGNARVLCNTSDYSPTFDEDDPLNWKVDTDKLDDISDARD
jgi:hypothetical protein